MGLALKYIHRSSRVSNCEHLSRSEISDFNTRDAARILTHGFQSSFAKSINASRMELGNTSVGSLRPCYDR